MTNKKELPPKPFFIPMPVVIIGTKIDNKPNYMAASFFGIMNYNPVLIAVSIGKGHLTNKGIDDNKVFSINVPSADMLQKTDYIGSSSTKTDEKADVFTAFYGKLKLAPMIVEAPVCGECKLTQKIDLGTNFLYIAEVVNLFMEKDILTNDQIDYLKANPVLFTMPDNSYYSLGKLLGTAWKLGKNTSST